MLLALELVALKVAKETRQRVKVMAAERRIEMWELVMDLVDREWEKAGQKSISSNQPKAD
jgi:hypothetical protein